MDPGFDLICSYPQLIMPVKKWSQGLVIPKFYSKNPAISSAPPPSHLVWTNTFHSFPYIHLLIPKALIGHKKPIGILKAYNAQHSCLYMQ